MKWTAIIALAQLATSSVRVYDVMPDSSDDINAAIDRSVEHMGFIARPMARHRLRVNNPLPRRVTFNFSADTIVVQLDGENRATLPRDGTAVPWRSIGGDKCQISLTVAGDTLIEHVTAEGGQSETRYVFSDSGRRVRRDQRITSSHLSAPVVYSVLFARAP